MNCLYNSGELEDFICYIYIFLLNSSDKKQTKKNNVLHLHFKIQNNKIFLFIYQKKYYVTFPYIIFDV